MEVRLPVRGHALHFGSARGRSRHQRKEAVEKTRQRRRGHPSGSSPRLTEARGGAVPEALDLRAGAVEHLLPRARQFEQAALRT